jgi:hypothetical protein
MYGSDTTKFRNLISDSNRISFGCSHTWGVGVEANETWSYILNSKNFGISGCSTDYIVRIAPDIIKEHHPDIIFVLWPDWTRFDYLKNNEYHTSLPMDKDRIHHMEKCNESWLKENFDIQVSAFKNLCKDNNIRLVDMTLYDLIPYLDHADRWPVSKLGHHYAPSWHKSVADLFADTLKNNIQHSLRYD